MKEKGLIITREDIESYNKHKDTIENINTGENCEEIRTEKFVNSKGEILIREIVNKNTLEQNDTTEKDNKQEPPKLSRNKIKFSLDKGNKLDGIKLDSNDIDSNELEEDDGIEKSSYEETDILVKEEKQIKYNAFEKTKFNYSMLIQILIELMIIFICLPIGMMFGWEHVLLILIITINTLAIQVRRLI